MSKQQQVGLMLISTGQYKQFVPKLLEEVKKYFLPEHNVTVFIFNDKYNEDYAGNERVKISQHPIPSYKWPYATLYRFRIFADHKYQLEKMDYLFYLDADMSICETVTSEILCEDGLTVVYHPGFYSRKDIVGEWGSNGVIEDSKAWIAPEKRKGYVAGGFNGGATEIFLDMAIKLAHNISFDEERGVIAEHNDESHTNAFIKNEYKGNILYLTPQFCMVEQMSLRKKWGIENINPSIIALSKDHAKIRE